MMAFWCKGKKDYCNDSSSCMCSKCKFSDGSGGIEIDDDDAVGIALCKWISVKDRLPDTTDVYLVNAVHRYNKSDGYRSVQVRLFFEDDDVNHWLGLPDLYEITHWMPLPEPPKEE